eukprot:766778-Hanusia_phi.AAC.8
MSVPVYDPNFEFNAPKVKAIYIYTHLSRPDKVKPTEDNMDTEMAEASEETNVPNPGNGASDDIEMQEEPSPVVAESHTLGAHDISEIEACSSRVVSLMGWINPWL